MQGGTFDKLVDVQQVAREVGQSALVDLGVQVVVETRVGTRHDLPRRLFSRWSQMKRMGLHMHAHATCAVYV